jgi:crotonobetainyl-CoA:carnitine CoA-transferase CaiB-like acyl-CoA transferase
MAVIRQIGAIIATVYSPGFFPPSSHVDPDLGVRVSLQEFLVQSPESSPAPSLAAPLSGITVVDLTRVMTGPYATMMLGDLGADVIKIERPGKGDDTRHWGPPFVDGEASYFLSVNRNKRSLALDLKSDAGKDVLARLIERADVLVENFSPGTMDRLGFGHEAMLAKHPSLIYASISGFGQTGPGKDRTAYDLIVQGMSGMMSITGHPGGPPTKLGVPIADIAAGMFAAFAINGALFARERDPERRGQYIDTSMLGGQIALLTYQAGILFTTGRVPEMLGNAHPIVAPYDTYPTADGFVNIAVGNDGIWQRFCRTMDLAECGDDPRFETNAGRITNLAELNVIVNAALSRLPTEEIVERLDRASVPCGPIHDVREVMDDPQVQHQELVRQVPHSTLGEVTVAGFPYHFSGTPIDNRYGPPVLGEHTREILAGLGYSDATIDAWCAAGVVQQAPAEPS